MPSQRELRGSRSRIATTLLDGEKTASEVGVKLKKPTGAVAGVLKRMASDGLLTASRSDLGRGTRYALTDQTRKDLLALEQPEVAPGMLRAGIQLIWVDSTDDLISIQTVLAQEKFVRLVLWVAEAGTGAMVIAMIADTTFPMQQLRAQLERAGARCKSTQIADVFGADELRLRTKILSENSE